MIEEQITQEKSSGFLSRLFRKKNPDLMISNASKNGLKRTLTAFDLTVLGIGAIIGAGIFTLSGTAAAGSEGHLGAGPGLILSFLLSGFACALAALCYAEFSSMIPVAGSAYAYTYATLGEIVAWMIGWILMLEYAIGSVTVASGWSGYLMQFMKGFEGTLPDWIVNPPVWLTSQYKTAAEKCVEQGLSPADCIPHIGSFPIAFNLPAILIVIAITAILFKGVKESTKMATLMVVIKMAVILLFVAIGAFHVDTANWSPFLPNGWPGVATGAFLVFFAYIGFDAVSTAAEETINPQKNVPIGIIASLVVCTLLYIAVAAVLTGMVPWHSIDTHAPVAAAMRAIKLDWIAAVISVGAIAGLTSVLLVMQLGTTRILFAMSRDKLLPPIFSKVHKKFGTPHIVTIIAGLFLSAGVLVLDLNEAAELCNIGTLSAFLMVCFSVLYLRIKDPKRKRPFKVPFGYIISSLGVITCLGLIVVGVPLKTMIIFSVWFAIGLLIYFCYGFFKTKDKVTELVIDNEPELPKGE